MMVKIVKKVCLHAGVDSKPRLLNLILLNLIVSGPRGQPL